MRKQAVLIDGKLILHIRYPLKICSHVLLSVFLALCIVTSTISCENSNGIPTVTTNNADGDLAEGTIQTIITHRVFLSASGEELQGLENSQCTRITYTRDGTLLESRGCDWESKSAGKQVYKYDKSGNIVLSEWHDATISFTQTNSYSYNSEDKVIKKTTSTYDGHSLSNRLEKETKVFVYEDDDLTETITYDSEGNIQARETWCYEGESLVEYNTYNKYKGSDFLQYKHLFKYDESGNLIEFVSYDQAGDDVLYKDIYINDNSGNPVEIKRYKADGSLRTDTTLQYVEFDDNGRWTKAIGHVQVFSSPDEIEEETDFVQERIITYYE